jgi:hypothetical protein
MADERKPRKLMGDPRNTLVTPWDGKVYPGDGSPPLSDREKDALKRGTGHRFEEDQPKEGDLVQVGSYVDEQEVLRNLPRDNMGNPIPVKGGRVTDRAAVRHEEVAEAAAAEAEAATERK